MADAALSIHETITDLDREAWNSLLAESGACPFLDWNFLALLEASGAVGDTRGWKPLYAVWQDGGQALAAAPFYIAGQEAGQFTWDGGMEEAALYAGSSWYPKLVGMVPFTPAMVWRPLHVASQEGLAAGAALLRAMAELAQQSGLGALHLQWLDPAYALLLESARPGLWVPWQRQYYLWTNPGSDGFDGWLAGFSKNMRRNIRRERQSLVSAGVRTAIVPASAAPRRYWDRMAEYYAATNDKFGPWAARFLPRDFFVLAPDYLAGLALFSAAWLPSQTVADPQDTAADPVGLALLFQGGDRLWGRYWGCAGDIPNLHFELCYNLPIEYALSQRLRSFDPGMGGHHKARRGFEAVLGRSLHQVFNPRLRQLFASAVAEASRAEAELAGELNRELPFRKLAVEQGSGPT